MKREIFEKTFKKYEVCYTKEMPDFDQAGVVLRHIKTGARVMLLPNDDDNKCFYIGFRTTPFNSTGVPHIIEHSVLCGSDKYPVKDPFVALAKTSLNTFLNAMTYPDKTIYPVASCNDKDIKNLMSVYMDAVFHPYIYRNEEIFKQEGWHYELEDKDAELKINGVVYSEMKGAFSTPEDVLDETIKQVLLPDTTYGYCSGGDPDTIPELSYEEFLDFHRKYYHPSNSYICLYGNFDMEERLQWLDEEYLSHYDYLEVDSAIKKQEPFKEAVKTTVEYPVGADEDVANKAYISYNVIPAGVEDDKKNMAISILNAVLFCQDGAPVRQALIDSGIGQEIVSSYNDYILQPYLTIYAKNADESRAEEFIQIIDDTLKKVMDEGIDKRALLGMLNISEFNYREADSGNTPRGLVYGINALGTWLYNDAEAFNNFDLGRLCAELRQDIETDYFEKLIDEVYLSNTHKAHIVALPVQGLNDKKEKALAEKLAALKNSLSAEEIDKLVEDTKALKAYQEEEDSEEALKTLPSLKISDVTLNVPTFSNIELEANGDKLIYHDVATGGIGYLKLCYDVSDLDDKYLPYLSLMLECLGSMDTSHYNYFDFTTECNLYTGEISVYPETVNMPNGEDYRSFVMVKTKYLTEYTKKALEIVEEYIKEADFSNTGRIKDIIGEKIASKQSSLVGAGHNTAIKRIGSYFSERRAKAQLTKEIEYYEFLKELDANFDTYKDEMVNAFRYLVEYIFDSEKLLISLTGKEEELNSFLEAYKDFSLTMDLSKKDVKEPGEGLLVREYKPVKRNEALKISGQIQYVGIGGNFKAKGIKHSGHVYVMKTLLAYDYLWINARVKGGAYGCFFVYEGFSGDCFLVSYRDPNLKETYDIYYKAAEYIRNLDITQEEIDGYIIGTLSNFDTPLLPSAQGERALGEYLQGWSREDRLRERKEILSTTLEDLKACAAVLDAAVEEGYICTVGNGSKLEENKDLFMEVKELV